MRNPSIADRSIAKQLLSKQVFQEDMHATFLQATADLATGLGSMKCKRPKPGQITPRSCVQSMDNSIHRLILCSFVVHSTCGPGWHAPLNM